MFVLINANMIDMLLKNNFLKKQIKSPLEKKKYFFYLLSYLCLASHFTTKTIQSKVY